MSSELLWSLIQRSGPQGPRSTALGQMLWALTILVGGILAGHKVGLPSGVLAALAVAVVVLVANFVGLHWYLAIKNPDALRSERFALTKIAMEREGWRGEDLIGFVRAIAQDEEGSSAGKNARAPRPKKAEDAASPPR